MGQNSVLHPIDLETHQLPQQQVQQTNATSQTNIFGLKVSCKSGNASLANSDGKSTPHTLR